MWFYLVLLVEQWQNRWMWTKAHRQRVVEQRKKRPFYPTDLNDDEWVLIHPFLPLPAKTGRPREVDLHEVLDAIRYLARMLPNDFPPSGTVNWWFQRFVRHLLFQTIHDVALMLDRERNGREASPSGSSTVKP